MSASDVASPATRTLQDLDREFIVHPHQVVGHPATPVVVVKGEGARVWDSNGNEYLDGTCGLWQCAVGHGRSDLARAASEQIEAIEFYTSFWDFSNEPSIRLAARLAELAGEGPRHVHFTSGGSEGNATAIKLARLAWDNAGEPDRTIVLSRESAYHGSGSGSSLWATGLPPTQEGFGPKGEGFIHLSAPHRGRTATDALIEELEETIGRIGAERIAAFIGEPIMGVGGVLQPPDDYWPRVEAVLRAHGILLIFDEVITAFGRLGHWFGFQRFGVTPDFVVTAKAITSGYIPFGAVLVGDRPLELLDGRLLRHGLTYNGHPVGAAVALENLAIIEREGLLDNVRERGAQLAAGLRRLADEPAVSEVRGEGLMWAVEFADADAEAVAASLRRRGVIVRGMLNRVLVSPPFVVSAADVDQLVEAIAGEVAAL
jgi:PLP-dependent transaminase